MLNLLMCNLPGVSRMGTYLGRGTKIQPICTKPYNYELVFLWLGSQWSLKTWSYRCFHFRHSYIAKPCQGLKFHLSLTLRICHSLRFVGGSGIC